jgi:hypothetical protein
MPFDPTRFDRKRFHMAVSLTSANRKSGSGCTHRTLVFNDNGVTRTWDTTDAEIAAGCKCDDPQLQFLALALKRRMAEGFTLDNLVGKGILG